VSKEELGGKSEGNYLSRLSRAREVSPNNLEERAKETIYLDFQGLER
jgi:hypothetical protein